MLNFYEKSFSRLLNIFRKYKNLIFCKVGTNTVEIFDSIIYSKIKYLIKLFVVSFLMSCTQYYKIYYSLQYLF